MIQLPYVQWSELLIVWTDISNVSGSRYLSAVNNFILFNDFAKLHFMSSFYYFYPNRLIFQTIIDNDNMSITGLYNKNKN